MRTKPIGGKYRFTYTNYGNPEGYPKYRAHSNQIVTITRKLRDDESEAGGGNKYMVKASDGWTGLALAEELRTPRKPRKSKQKKVYVVCRHVMVNKVHWPVFYTACSTMDQAQRTVDKLTLKMGPAFIIIDAPMDP